jgi:hypothetical protein
MAGITGDFHGHFFVTIDTVSPNIVDMSLIVARGFTCLSVIVASTAVHFKIRCLDFLVISVMAVITPGKRDVVAMVKDHVTAAGVEPNFTWRIR